METAPVAVPVTAVAHVPEEMALVPKAVEPEATREGIETAPPLLLFIFQRWEEESAYKVSKPEAGVGAVPSGETWPDQAEEGTEAAPPW